MSEGLPDPEYYEGVGRVVVAAANLDVALACMVFMMSTFVEAIDLWGIVADPGRPLRDARRLTSQMPRGDIFARAREIVAEAEEALIERNRVTHSVPVHPRAGTTWRLFIPATCSTARPGTPPCRRSKSCSLLLTGSKVLRLRASSGSTPMRTTETPEKSETEEFADCLRTGPTTLP
jgi:hypothetical protein